MSLYSEWVNKYESFDEAEYQAFWKTYLPKEQKVYEKILATPDKCLEGKFLDLSVQSEMDSIEFIAFLDGINESVKEAFDLDSITEESTIKFDVDFEKLYYNMLDAKADWLYNLPQWNSILTADERKAIKKAYDKTRIVVNENKIGRNEPCTCGSGKKYKKCCGK